MLINCTLLESQLERLSEPNKRASDWLASQDEPVNLSQQPVNLKLSQSKFGQMIQLLP